MANGRAWPHVRYGKATCAVKNEDVCFLKQDISAKRTGPLFSFYCICDGHNGPAAARFVEQTLISEVMDRMPAMHFPRAFQTAEGKEFAAKVREAIIEAFAAIDSIWRTQNIASGTTVTIAVVVGWLLTVANIGDSLAFLRTAGNVYPMTANHRLASNLKEVNRLREAGVQVARVSEGLDGPAESDGAGFGPLRAWPGGLAVGRSLGDIDARPEVVCRPHIKQVVVPAEMGARLVLASDGLWDALAPKKVMSIIKTPSVEAASTKLVATARSSVGGVLTDDVSVLVLDIVPKSMVDAAAPKHVKKNAAWKCCSSTTDDDRTRVEFISDVDSLQWFPLGIPLPTTGGSGGLEREPNTLSAHFGQSLDDDDQRIRGVGTHHSTTCPSVATPRTPGRRRSASVSVGCCDSGRAGLEREPRSLAVHPEHSHHGDDRVAREAGARQSTACSSADHASASGMRRTVSAVAGSCDGGSGVLDNVPRLTVRLGAQGVYEDEQRRRGTAAHRSTGSAMVDHAGTPGKRRSASVSSREAVSPASPFVSASSTPRGSPLALPRCDSAADVREGSQKPRERVRKAAGMVEYTSRHFGPRRLDSAHIGS